MRLYCITRNDLTTGQKTAQICHAAAQYMLDHGTEWNNSFIICLETSKEELLKLKQKLELTNKKHSSFFEPDFNHELTAISAIDNSGKLFSQYKLIK
jgi:chromosome condensin MukBEF ATPase and DNA-binding subunit MukB